MSHKIFHDNLTRNLITNLLPRTSSPTSRRGLSGTEEVSFSEV